MDSLTGFRFKPTDEEIIDLLKQKRRDPNFSVPTIKELDIYKFDPWELPGFCEIQSKEEALYFFCEPYYKYAKSKRVHRRTKTGYYKVTGQGSKPKNSCGAIGTKKILTFCRNINTGFEKPKTKWVMHQISIGDDPLYKKDFVVCRLERKWVTKRGISTRDEDQPSQELTNCSSIDVTEVISSESDLPLDQPMVSNRNHVAENIFSKTDKLIFQSRNHVAENTGLGYEVLASDHLISHSRNHVAENTSLESILPPPNQHLVSNRNHVAENTWTEPQVLPSHGLVSSLTRNHVAEITAAESQLLASQHLASYSRNHVAEMASPEWQQLANHTSISYARNHVAENTCTESQVLPSHSLVSSYSRNHVAEITAAKSQLLASQNLAGYSRNHFVEIASPEWQQLANNSISYSRNHVAKNASLEYMVPPPNQHLVSNRNHVAENTWTEPQVLPSHALVSGITRNQAAESQLLASQNLAGYSRNHVAEIASPEWQQLANHTSISYSRNHVAENAPAELQIVSNDNSESLILPSQQSGSYSTNFLERTFEAGPRPLPEFNPHSDCNGLINASIPALQSLIYPQQESLYSNCSSYDFDLLNSQFYSDQGDDLINSLLAFQNESSCEGLEQTLNPDFNSSTQLMWRMALTRVDTLNPSMHG